MSLSAPRNTPERLGGQLNDPVAAATVILAGALVALNATGYLVPGSESDALVVRGRAEQSIDNAAGADGDLRCESKRGVFRWNNSATDPVDRTHIGAAAYIEDDQTVSATDNAGARSAAGTVEDVDEAGVWVKT